MNAKIEKAYQAGLSILKPSPAELERGLELHRDALVWDAYGFAPAFPLDNKTIEPYMEEGATVMEVNHRIEEARSIGGLDNPGAMAEYREAWEASGVDCVFQNAGEEGNGLSTLFHRLCRFTYLLDSARDLYVRTPFPEDVEGAKRQGKRALYLTTNGVPLPGQWQDPELELSYIRHFFQLGVRMAHLTYNRHNMIGGGCGEKEERGLTTFGEAVIREMNKVGMIPDAAHSCSRTAYEAAKASSKPVVISHASVAALSDSCRAKDDKAIKAVADTGGYIGICGVAGILRRSGDINSLLDHIDYVAKKFGADHVAIGLDASYTPMKSDSPKRIKQRGRFESLWPKDSFGPEWQKEEQTLSMAWTNWPLFTVGMVQRGHKDDDIRKILGGNVLRVAKASLENTRPYDR